MVYSRAGSLDLFFDLWERDNPLQLHVLKLFHFVFLFLFFHILLYNQPATYSPFIPSLYLQPWSNHLGTIEEMRRENAPHLIKLVFYFL